MGARKIRRKKIDTAEVELTSMLQQARRERGLTQKQLADRAGTSQASISRVENDLSDATYSTLRKIVETGLGGELELAIKL